MPTYTLSQSRLKYHTDLSAAGCTARTWKPDRDVVSRLPSQYRRHDGEAVSDRRSSSEKAPRDRDSRFHWLQPSKVEVTGLHLEEESWPHQDPAWAKLRCRFRPHPAAGSGTISFPCHPTLTNHKCRRGYRYPHPSAQQAELRICVYKCDASAVMPGSSGNLRVRYH